MPSTFRIPAAPITGLYGRAIMAYARRAYGKVPDTVLVLLHHRPILQAVFAFERRIARWHVLDDHLKTYAEMAAAGAIGCNWCLDFGYYLAHRKGLDETKVAEVPRWRESPVFTDLERDVMAYAESMTATPVTVTDEMVAGLIDRLGVPAVVELTEIVAVENLRSRFNAAAGLQSQGYSDVCTARLATPIAASGASSASAMGGCSSEGRHRL